MVVKAAESGNGEAAYFLARAAALGGFIPKILRRLEMAAESGQISAQIELGAFLFSKREEGEENAIAARKWLNAAVGSHETPHFQATSFLRFQEQVLPRERLQDALWDDPLVVERLGQAANRREVEAQKISRHLHQHGSFALPDANLAKRFSETATKSGGPQARNMADSGFDDGIELLKSALLRKFPELENAGFLQQMPEMEDDDSRFEPEDGEFDEVSPRGVFQPTVKGNSGPSSYVPESAQERNCQ